MKKLIFVLLLVTVFFSGCGSLNSASIIDDTMPVPFNESENGGGDLYGTYHAVCSVRLSSIPKNFSNLVNQEDFSVWLEKHNESINAEKISERANLFSFIADFDISYETALSTLSELNEIYKQYNMTENIFTQEEMEAIASRNEAYCAENLCSEYAISVGDKIYSPEYIYTHTADNYAALDISADELLSKSKLYDLIPFTEEAHIALSNKIMTYALSQAEEGKLSGTYAPLKYSTVEIPEWAEKYFLSNE